MTTCDSNAEEVAPSLWRLADGMQVASRTWQGETVIYFHPSDETMVVNELGATAINGILAGCGRLDHLEDWCRTHGFADAGEELRIGLQNLLAHLSSLEIIIPTA